MDLSNQAAMIATNSSDKLNKVLDKLSNFSLFLAFMNKFYKAVLFKINEENAKDETATKAPVTNIAWEDEGEGSEKLLEYGNKLGEYRLIGNNKKLEAIEMLPADLPDFMQRLANKQDGRYQITKDVIKKAIAEISEEVASVVQEKTTSGKGLIIDNFSNAAFDNILIDSFTSMLGSKVKIINDMITNIPNKVSLFQSASQTLQRAIEALMSIISQLLNRQ